MNKRNVILFICLLSAALCNAAMQEIDHSKRLILNVDVNKTIISMDLVQGKDLKETVNMILAEQTAFEWNGRDKQSYFDYISDLIAEKEPELSRSGDEFKTIRNKLLLKFPEFLSERHPELFEEYKIEWAKMLRTLGAEEQDLEDLEDSIFNHEKRITTAELVIFPSFFELINWLEENYKDQYSIVLRTFGSDLPNVIPIIKKRSTLNFESLGKFKALELTVNDEVTDYLSFFKCLDNHHCAIRDDYPYWRSKNFQTQGGKLFVVNPEDKETIAMFFDDNADDKYRPILHPVNPDGQDLDTKTLIDLGIIVGVNPKAAILDEKYFINKVIQRLQKV